MLWLKLALARPQDAALLLESFAAQERGCVERLQAYSEEVHAPAGASEWERLARELIDEATTIQLHGELEWLSKMRARIERLHDAVCDSEGAATRQESAGRASAAA